MKEKVAGQAADLEIWAFPDDDRIRRIAWFGQVDFVNRAMMRNQPSVLVYLAEVPGRLMRTNNLDCPINPKYVSLRTITTWVAVGTMTLLRIGDLWKGRRLFYRPALEFETFKAVDIAPRTVKEVQAGVKLEDGHHMLPFSEHPWHAECTQSFCSRVTLPDGRLLVIPAIELIRFYFGSSSTLLRALFRTDLKRELLYERVKVLPTTRHMFLDLAVGMQRSSASDEQLGLMRLQVLDQNLVQVGHGDDGVVASVVTDHSPLVQRQLVGCHFGHEQIPPWTRCTSPENGSFRSVLK